MILDTLKTVWRFAKGILGPKKREYILSFKKESDNLWYIDIPWDWEHGNLQMVGGADKLLAYLDPEEVTISCMLSDPNDSNYFKLTRKNWGWTKGAFYSVEGLKNFNRDIWICPVTLCVLGKYPKDIYIKVL